MPSPYARALRLSCRRPPYSTNNLQNQSVPSSSIRDPVGDAPTALTPAVSSSSGLRLCPPGSRRPHAVPDLIPRLLASSAESRSRPRPIAENPRLGMDRLPQDALVAILSRLAPRSLAASRCVCKEWRAAVDARCKLRADLLPFSLGGIFVNLSNVPAAPAFFARPSMARKIAGNLASYVETGLPADFMYIKNSCNGLLLLCDGQVVNPATGQWACLPPSPPTPDGLQKEKYIVFDPTVSKHYEVLLLPDVPCQFDFMGDLLEGTAWPPSPCITQVFSSRTGRWEQRSFTLEGEPAGTIADVMSSSDPSIHSHAVYWRETLYVHCRGAFLMRLKLSDDNYQVIKLPPVTTMDGYPEFYLGKSKNGVYLARVNYQFRLHIWFLNESDHKTEWILKNSLNLEALFKHYKQNCDDRTTGHWILQNGNFDEENKGPIVETNFDWNSDDDNALNIEDWDPEGFRGYHIFGFHPYKEIIFLHLDRSVLAYHFSSSKYQDLGMLRVNCSFDGIKTGFTYTPCWIGELS